MLGSWLSGPQSFREAAGLEVAYPGKRLGLPEQGQHAVASFSRRLAATFIDWTIARLIVAGIPTETGAEEAGLLLVVFGVLNLTLISTIGAGVGGRLLGLRVARLDGRNPLPGPVVVRTLFLLLVIPALIWDRDQRGLHDQAARCVVVRR